MSQSVDSVVIDTHILIWYLLNPPRLSRDAYAALAKAESVTAPVYVSAITVVELRYLIEKKVVTETGYQMMLTKFNDPQNVLEVTSLNLATADKMAQIPRSTVPEMPDRIIAATALALGLPLVTADTEIRKLTNIPIIW